jgi:hypothetical protein
MVSCTAFPDERDDRRVGVGNVVAEERRPVRRANPLGLDEVLVRDWQSVQRAARLPARELLVGGRGVCHRAIRDECHDRVDGGVHALDLGEVRLHDLACRHFLRTNHGRELGRRREAKVARRVRALVLTGHGPPVGAVDGSSCRESQRRRVAGRTHGG